MNIINLYIKYICTMGYAVAQCLNQLRYRVPVVYNNSAVNKDTGHSAKI